MSRLMISSLSLPYCFCHLSRCGISSRQNPHHKAHKFRTRALPFLSPIFTLVPSSISISADASPAGSGGYIEGLDGSPPTLGGSGALLLPPEVAVVPVQPLNDDNTTQKIANRARFLKNSLIDSSSGFIALIMIQTQNISTKKPSDKISACRMIFCFDANTRICTELFLNL